MFAFNIPILSEEKKRKTLSEEDKWINLFPGEMLSQLRSLL